MDIRVSGHQVETGAALQEHAADRLGDIVEKYFERAISSHVTFGKVGSSAFSCDIVTHVKHRARRMTRTSRSITPPPRSKNSYDDTNAA